MARIRTDSDRAAMLQALLSQQGSDAQDAGQVMPNNSRMPMPVDALMGSENPAREDEQQMINQKMGGQEDMVMVPRKMAMTAMQMLMQQGSANSIGKANGADGQMASLPDNAEVPGEEPTTDDEVEAAEEYQRNKGKKTLNNMRS